MSEFMAMYGVIILVTGSISASLGSIWWLSKH